MTAAVAPGESTMAYCKVCKSVVDHSIVTMKGKKPTRVKCTTCEEAHPYRVNAPAARKKKAAKGAARGEASYERLIQGRDLSHALKYDTTRQFANDDLLDHAKFGVGFVTKVLADQKIEVLFPDGRKTLVHDR